MMLSLSSEVGLFITRSLRCVAPEQRADTNMEEFNRLALALFAAQFEAVPVYREFCQGRKVSPASIADWTNIPALPTSAFKEYELSSIPPEERAHVFHSSGTTGQIPSRHFHHSQSLAVYEASLLPWFERHFVGGMGAPSAPLRFIFLTPENAPHSSLVHMFATVRRHFGRADSEFAGRIEADGAWSLDLDRLLAVLTETCRDGEPIGLLGTAFSFVHLLDHLAAVGKRFPLPKGSRVMETGGYKGRSRTVPKPQLRRLMTKYLGIAEKAILTEYGMSELSSQAYESEGAFRFPPWARVQVISPETGAKAAEGETGLLEVFDLANIWSVMAVQTEDLAAEKSGAFVLMGRAAAAETRGCSLLAAQSPIW